MRSCLPTFGFVSKVTPGHFWVQNNFIGIKYLGETKYQYATSAKLARLE